jgi:hypothetical protein
MDTRVPDDPASIIEYPRSSGPFPFDPLPELLSPSLDVNRRLGSNRPFLGDRGHD